MNTTRNPQRVKPTPRALVGLAGLLIGPGAGAQLFLTVGDWEVPVGTSQTTLELRVMNSGPSVSLLGVNLNLQVADGGSAAGGSQTGPSIVAVNLFAPGALFEANNNGAGGSGSIVPQIFETGTLARPGTTVSLEAGSELLASVLLDTSGFSVGENWTVTLDTLNGPSSLLNAGGQPMSATLIDGHLSIIAVAVPEPWASATAVGGALLTICLMRKSRGHPHERRQSQRGQQER